MYRFRIEEDQPGAGDVVEVEFEQMMAADSGFLTLADGRKARRIFDSSSRTSTQSVKASVPPKIVSDAMGFPASALKEFEADRKANGFRDIEFRPDPDVPQFVQVHCSSTAAKERYMRHRAMHDRNSVNGSSAMLSPKLFEQAKELVLRQHS